MNLYFLGYNIWDILGLAINKTIYPEGYSLLIDGYKIKL